MKKALLALGVAACWLLQRTQTSLIRSSSSVSLNVDGAGSVATRIPSSMAVSGSNVTLGTVPTLSSHSAGTALGYTPGAFTITSAGDSFSYSESYTEGDNVPSSSQQQSPQSSTFLAGIRKCDNDFLEGSPGR